MGCSDSAGSLLAANMLEAVFPVVSSMWVKVNHLSPSAGWPDVDCSSDKRLA